jgi:hypothetical protein
MMPSPKHIRDWAPHLKDHPAAQIRIHGPQSMQGGVEILRNSYHFSIEQGHTLPQVELLAVPPACLADLFSDLLIDVYFIHRQPPITHFTPPRILL